LSNESDEPSIRDELTVQERALTPEHTIDPGFVHREGIETALGPDGMRYVDEAIRQLPAMTAHMADYRIDHIYKNYLLGLCQGLKVKTLAEVLASGRGRMFCSTEKVLPNAEVYTKERTRSEVEPAGQSEYKVLLEYSTRRIASDTLRSELHNGAQLSIVAKLRRREGGTLIFYPLVIGGPWLWIQDEHWGDKLAWWGYHFYEHFIGDFAEFSRVKDIPTPDTVEPMRHVSEKAFKACLGKILGDNVTSDWGGEQSDHYTSRLHLGDRRVTAAFLLKGPAKFVPMGLDHLGKRNDQIYRLAQEPADILIVQHAHDITPPVRATLRAFTVQPGRPRRYCLIDGRDSLWLLRAYDLYDEAIRISENPEEA
jgi:hypothetical protein